MAVTVFNSKPGQVIFIGKVNFFPGNTIIKKEKDLEYLRKDRETFDSYCTKKIPGTLMTILKIVAGSLDEVKKPAPIKGKGKGKGKEKGKDKPEVVNSSPLAGQTESDAITTVESMLDVDSLEFIRDNETREPVKNKAIEMLEMIQN